MSIDYNHYTYILLPTSFLMLSTQTKIDVVITLGNKLHEYFYQGIHHRSVNLFYYTRKMVWILLNEMIAKPDLNEILQGY